MYGLITMITTSLCPTDNFFLPRVDVLVVSTQITFFFFLFGPTRPNLNNLSINLAT